MIDALTRIWSQKVGFMAKRTRQGSFVILKCHFRVLCINDRTIILKAPENWATFFFIKTLLTYLIRHIGHWMLRLAVASTFTQYALSVVAIRFRWILVWPAVRNKNTLPTKYEVQGAIRQHFRRHCIYFNNAESGGKVSVHIYKAMVYTLMQVCSDYTCG